MEYFIVTVSGVPRSGNALFWRPGESGYTTNMAKAGRYSEADAKRIIAMRGQDYAVPCCFAETHAHLMLDHEEIRKYTNRACGRFVAKMIDVISGSELADDVAHCANCGKPIGEHVENRKLSLVN